MHLSCFCNFVYSLYFLQLECSYTLYGNQIISHTKERKKERTNAKTTVIERTENDLNLQKQKSPNVLNERDLINAKSPCKATRMTG